MRFKLASL